MDSIALEYDWEKDKNTSYFKKLFNFIIVWMALGNVYLFPLFKSVDMGELMIIATLPLLAFGHIKVYLKKKFRVVYIFFFYAFIVSVLMSISLGGEISNPMIRMMRDGFYIFVIVLGAKYYDYKLFKKSAIVFCLILSAYIFIQVLLYYSTGYLLPGLIMNAFVNDGGYKGADIYEAMIAYANIGGYLKPNGFMCEPAHCAQYFCVTLILLLFDDEKEKSALWNAVIISLATILTMSTSAFLYLILVWGIWLKIEGKNHSIFLLFGIAVIMFFLIVSKGNGGIEKITIVMHRFTNVFSGGVVANSSQLRILKGFSVFDALPVWLKMVGIGFGNYKSVVSPFLINSNINMVENEYMSTASYLLVSTGIVGFLLLVYLWGKLFISGTLLVRVTLVALVVMSLGASIYSSPIWIWMALVILYSGKDEYIKRWQMQ